jgi:hypothetical protein
MTSVRKKTSGEIYRTPRGAPKSLRSTINPDEVSIYRGMRKAIIQELRPKTPIEWILVNELVNAQFSARPSSTAIIRITWTKALPASSPMNDLLHDMDSVPQRLSKGRRKRQIRPYA